MKRNHWIHPVLCKYKNIIDDSRPSRFLIRFAARSSCFWDDRRWNSTVKYAYNIEEAKLEKIIPFSGQTRRTKTWPGNVTVSCLPEYVEWPEKGNSRKDIRKKANHITLLGMFETVKIRLVLPRGSNCKIHFRFSITLLILLLIDLMSRWWWFLVHLKTALATEHPEVCLRFAWSARTVSGSPTGFGCPFAAIFRLIPGPGNQHVGTLFVCPFSIVIIEN